MKDTTDTCEYGCPSEGADLICLNCGHSKFNHSPIHPHACNCKLDDEGHKTSHCECKEFRRSYDA